MLSSIDLGNKQHYIDKQHLKNNNQSIKMTEMEDVLIADESPAPPSINDVENPVEDISAVTASTKENMELEKTVEENDEAATNKSCGSKCCGWMNFHGVPEAKGYAILGTARGAVVMSNIFLSTSLIYLASEEAGCIDENGVAIPDCDNTVHGFQPPSLIANIAVISGLLSAFLMPVIGAIVDYTPYRRATGIIAALLLVLIQGVQVRMCSRSAVYVIGCYFYSCDSEVCSAHTSFFLHPSLLVDWNRFCDVVPHGCTSSILSGFIYQVEVLATYAYLPEIARAVGEKIMTQFTSSFVMLQFSAQALFLIVVIVISGAIGLNDVNTGTSLVRQSMLCGSLLAFTLVGNAAQSSVPA
jgi:hypothetical protein